MFDNSWDVRSSVSTFLSRIPVALLALCAACGGGSDTTTSGPSNGSPSSYSLTVSLDGSGTVQSSPGSINCGSTCAGTFTSGTPVTLTATPDSDYDFESWSVSGTSCPSTTSCTTTMTTARSVTVTFRRKSRLLTVNVTGSGGVTSSPAGIDCGSDCTESVRYGTAVTLTATPASGYNFSGWSGSGVSCPGTGTCTVTMTSATTVTATFSPIVATTYQLQVAISGSGTVSSSPGGITCGSDCTENFTDGTSVTLAATPSSGYNFSGWSGGGCAGTSSCTVSMTAAKTVTATFVPSTYPMAVTVSGSGTVSSSPNGISCGTDCSENFANGASVTLNATPASGYDFSGWSGSGVSCAGTGSCAVSMTAARNITATFSAKPTYPLTVTVAGSGSVNSSPAGISCGSDCAENYISGTTVTLTATAASGNRFSGWSGACSGTSTCTVSIDAAKAVTATFVSSTPTATYRLNWNAVSDSRVTGYMLYYSTTPLSTGGSMSSVAVGNVTSYVFNPASTILKVGDTAYFGISAIGGGLESSLSDVVSVVIE